MHRAISLLVYPALIKSKHSRSRVVNKVSGVFIFFMGSSG
jgi:hypothetical protein